MAHPWFAQYRQTRDPNDLWFQVEQQMFPNKNKKPVKKKVHRQRKKV